MSGTAFTKALPVVLIDQILEEFQPTVTDIFKSVSRKVPVSFRPCKSFRPLRTFKL